MMSDLCGLSACPVALGVQARLAQPPVEARGEAQRQGPHEQEAHETQDDQGHTVGLPVEVQTVSVFDRGSCWFVRHLSALFDVYCATQVIT